MKLSRLGQPPAPAIIHTSAFADAADQGKSSFGAMSPESFEQRRQVDRNRQHIATFRAAGIHHEYRQQPQSGRPIAPASRAVTTPRTTTMKPTPPPQIVSRPAAGYREPQQRGFNPYR